MSIMSCVSAAALLPMAYANRVVRRQHGGNRHAEGERSALRVNGNVTGNTLALARRGEK